jgi:hypothetical protein
MKRLLYFLLLLIPVMGLGQSVGQFRYDTVKFYKQGGQTVVKIQGALQAEVQGSVNTTTFTASSIGRSFILGEISTDEIVTFPTLESGRIGTFMFAENRNESVNNWNVAGPVKDGNNYTDVLTIPKGIYLFWWNNTDWLKFNSGSGSVRGDTIIFINGPGDAIYDTLLVDYDDSTVLAKVLGTDLPPAYKEVTANSIKWNIAQYISDSAGGGLTLAAVGSTPNANGATYSGGVLNLEPADDTHGGVITTGTQYFQGFKTFYTAPSFPSGTYTNATAGMGWGGLLQWDSIGPAGFYTTIRPGLMAGSVYFKWNQDSMRFEAGSTQFGWKTIAYKSDITGGVTTMAAVGSSPNANGASISGSTLTLQPADISTPGVLTAGTQTIGGEKQMFGRVGFLSQSGIYLEGSSNTINRPTLFTSSPHIRYNDDSLHLEAGSTSLGGWRTIAFKDEIPAGGGGSGSVTSVATGYGLTGGTITTTGTLKADSNSLATRAVLYKVRDSLAATINPAIANRKYLGNVSGSSAAPTELNYSVFNVKDFGLVDDSSTDNTTALRALIAQVPDGASIYFPGGGLGYLFTDSILINKNVIIYGDGRSSYTFYTTTVTSKGATTLYLNSGTKNLFSFRASVTNLFPIIAVRDLTIKNTAGSAPTAGAAIAIYDNVSRSDIQRLTIYRFYNNINIIAGQFVNIENCDIVAPVQNGIVLSNIIEPDGGAFRVTNCRIISGYVSTTTARGIYIKGGGGMYITDNLFNAAATLTVNTQFMYGIYSDFADGPTSEIQITNNFFDNYQTNAIRLRNYSGTRIPNFLINNNQIAPLTGSSTNAAIDVNGFNNILIDNTVGQSAALAYPLINLDSCTGVTIGAASYTGYNAKYAATAQVTGIIDFGVSATGLSGGQTIIGGTGSGENITLTSTSHATKGKINTGNLYVVGTALSGSSITSNFLNVTGTLNSTNSAEADGVAINITGAGSSSQNQVAANVSLLAGYTGSLTTEAISANNYSVGTGNVISGAATLAANIGMVSVARATATSSTNMGGFIWATGGQKNVGVVGDATLSQYNNAAGISIGTIGFAKRAHSSAIHIGGYFGLQTAAPTFESAALIADNGAETSPIFLLRDNGTKVLTVADGGAVRIGDATSPTDKLEVTGNIALTTAGNKIKIATGTNASVGTSTLVAGTVTVSTTAVTASSKIFLTCGVVGGTQGILSVGTITGGTSFVINSSNAADTSQINWFIIN